MPTGEEMNTPAAQADQQSAPSTADTWPAVLLLPVLLLPALLLRP